MTKKETLIREYFALKNSFDINEPGCVKPCSAEPSEIEIFRMSKEFKVIDLEDKIEAVKRAIEDQKMEKKKQEFFATEEGKEFKDNLKNKMNQLRKERENVMNNFRHIVSTEINSFLGNNFDCKVSSNEIEIGVKEKNNKRIEKGFELKFGHTFTVSFNNYHYKVENNFLEVNYPTYGSFNLNDTDRIDYINGMARFLNNKELQNFLINHFNLVENLLNKIGDEMDNCRRKLDNPFN